MQRQSKTAPEGYEKSQTDFNTFHNDGNIEVFEEEAVKLVGVISQLCLDVPIKSLLDVGCRTGYMVDAVATRFPGARVAGIDIIPKFIEIAAETGCEVKVADMHEIPYGDMEFDWVVCSQALEHGYDVKKAVSELVRVCGVGLIISVPLENAASFEKNPSHYYRHEDTWHWLDLFPREGWQILYARKNGDVFDFGLVREGSYASALPRV